MHMHYHPIMDLRCQCMESMVLRVLRVAYGSVNDQNCLSHRSLLWTSQAVDILLALSKCCYILIRPTACRMLTN